MQDLKCSNQDLKALAGDEVKGVGQTEAFLVSGSI